MIIVPITKTILLKAEEHAKTIGVLNNSITEGEGNLAGFIGEIVFCDTFGWKHSNTYDYDAIRRDKTADVKTKRCTSPPRPYYECSVAAFNIKQKCDYYVFVRVEQTDSGWGNAYILGYLPKDEYFRKAKPMKKGELDPSNGFTVKANCYNVAISQLRQLD